jgi:DNA-binding MarR family transcriptional regulator
MQSTEEQTLITGGFPTDTLGWLLALCSKLVREGLTSQFDGAGFNVTPEQWSLLAHLWQKDGLSQQALADRFHRSKVAAFHLISKLEEQGLIVRLPNPEDGRSNLIYLTAEGRAMVSELIPLSGGNLEKAAEGISERDLATTRTVLCRIIDNMHR